MSASVAAAAAAAVISGVYQNSSNNDEQREPLPLTVTPQGVQVCVPPTLSRYENQKRRDWNTFGQYLKNHRPPLTLSRCSGAHVLEFLRYLDQFGKTKVHAETCAYFGNSHPPGPCPCPLKQAWGSLDALIGRLRAAFEENGGSPEMNPFGARAVRLYLREVRDAQAKARGIAYEKKKRRKPNSNNQQEQNGSMMIMEDNPPIHHHDLVSSRAMHHSSGYNNPPIQGLLQLSNSNGSTSRDAAASSISYFSY